MQALGFVGCLALDMMPVNREHLPRWYRHMRVPLSIGAAASMLLTAAAYRDTHGMDSGLSVLRPVNMEKCAPFFAYQITQSGPHDPSEIGK